MEITARLSLSAPEQRELAEALASNHDRHLSLRTDMTPAEAGSNDLLHQLHVAIARQADMKPNTDGFLTGYKSGGITWRRGDEVTGSIGLSVSTEGDSGTMWLNYTKTNSFTEEKKHFNYSVSMVGTTCNYGGRRWWFHCPIRGCVRRVAKLYLPPGADYFGCRSCYKLTYESCRMSHSFPYKLAKAHGMTLGQLGRALRND